MQISTPVALKCSSFCPFPEIKSFSKPEMMSCSMMLIYPPGVLCVVHIVGFRKGDIDFLTVFHTIVPLTLSRIVSEIKRFLKTGNDVMLISPTGSTVCSSYCEILKGRH